MLYYNIPISLTTFPHNDRKDRKNRESDIYNNLFETQAEKETPGPLPNFPIRSMEIRNMPRIYSKPHPR